MKARLGFSTGCAWTGLYLSVADAGGSDRFTARVVLDPTDARGPRLSAGGAVILGAWSARPAWFPARLWITSWRHEVRLPHVPWRVVPASRYNVLVLLAYRVTSRFWHRLDGRYGGPLTDLPGAWRRLLTSLRRERARGVAPRGGKAGW